MKLLMENWRSYLVEQEYLEGQKLAENMWNGFCLESDFNQDKYTLNSKKSFCY